MELGLNGKIAIITGASFGLGRASAVGLAQEGARIAICGRNMDTLEAAAAQIEGETGGEVMPFAADVREPADISRFVEATVARFGGVDILINNADAGGHEGGFFEVSDEAWLARLEVKLFAAIRFTREVAPFMISHGWGRIINITSPTSRRITSQNGGWSKGASQAGIINLTKRLSLEFGTHGITVNALEPGRMNDVSDQSLLSPESQEDAQVERQRIERAAKEAGVSYEEMEREIVGRLVIGRRIRFEDTANVVVFMASECSATITGEVIVADGGQNPSVRY